MVLFHIGVVLYLINEQFTHQCLICDIFFRVDRGFCDGALEHIRSSYPAEATLYFSASRTFLCVPLNNMLLCVLSRPCGTPSNVWMQLSAEEFLVSSGLQPLPRSAFLDPLASPGCA